MADLFQSPRGRMAGFALTGGLLGLLVNAALPVPLYPGIDLLFGFVPVLIVALLGGWGWGLAAAMLASIPTVGLWGHPHAFVLFGLEAVLVGALARRVHPTLLVMALWVLVGAPYLVLMGWGGGDATAPRTSLLVLKNMFQESFASLLALNLLLLAPVRQRLTALLRAERAPVVSLKSFQTSFVALLVVATFGASVLIQSRQVYQEQRTLMSHFNDRAASAIANDLESSLLAYAAVLRASAAAWAQLPAVYRDAAAQQALRWSDMQAFIWFDNTGRMRRGWSYENGTPRRLTAGALDALAPTLRATRPGELAVHVLEEPGVFPQPMALLVAPVQTGGYLVGGIELRRISQRLQDTLPYSEAWVEVITASGERVLTSSNIGPPAPSATRPWGPTLPQAGDLVSRAPVELAGWEARVVIPAWVIEDQVADALWRNLPALLAVLLLLSALGMALMLALGGELRQLGRATQRLGEVDGPAPEFPDSAIREIRDLYATYHGVSASLRDTMQALRARRAELVLANSQLAATVDELETLDQNRSELINAISHDIKIPLTAVVGYAELLEDELAGELNADQHSYVKGIEENAGRVIRLLEDLLDLARLGVGRFPIHPEAIEAGEALSATKRTLAPLVEQKHLSMAVEVDPELPEAWADPGRLGQVLNNLVSNAIKFTPDGGRIWLRAFPAADGKHLTIQIVDTGIGIPAEHLPRLFERFYRVSGTGAAGTGLGLAISKKLIEAMGGTIGVLSEPGRGSTFWFTLPLAYAPTTTESTAPTAS